MDLHHQHPPKQVHTSHPRRWRFFIWGLVLLIIGVIGWVAVASAIAFKNITTKNTSDAPDYFTNQGTITPDQLKKEGASRINTLFIGVGGTGHKGGTLADTVQIVSIDPINKTMSMLSLPRDFYVTQATGERSKLNAVYANGEAYCKIKNCPVGVDPGGVAMKETVSSVLDIPIHYFARIDFTGFKKIVDTLGGVTINVEKTLNDPYFPDANLVGYEPLYIPAGLQKFDGAKALKYARSRETTSDFDRARRQQQIISAVREKAISLNVLGNPKKVTELISVLGTNLRTDTKLDEMLKLMTLIKEIDSSESSTTVLDTSAEGPLKSLTDPQAGYIIVPKKGLKDYSELRLFVAGKLIEPYLIKEKAKVTIIDASGKSGMGKKVEDQLTELGYNVVANSNADKTSTTTTVSTNKDKPYTVSLLKSRLGAAAAKSSTSEISDITVTLGSNYILK